MFPDGRAYVEGLFILCSSEVLGAKPPSLYNENLDRSEKLKVVLCNLVTRESPQCESVLYWQCITRCDSIKSAQKANTNKSEDKRRCYAIPGYSFVVETPDGILHFHPIIKFLGDAQG
jgi:hypothetical protein